VVEQFGATAGDEGGDVFGHEYIINAGGATCIGGRFVGGSEGEVVDVNLIVFREDSGETMHVETKIFIEVSAEDDLVTFVKLELEE
jgi:hypothetical protein